MKTDKEIVEEFELACWGLAPEGSLKHKRGEEIKDWLLTTLKEVREEEEFTILKTEILNEIIYENR